MKTFINFLLLLSIFKTAHAQPIVTMSNEMKGNDFLFKEFAGKTSDSFFYVRLDPGTAKDKVSIVRFDKNYAETESAELNMKADGDNIRYNNAVVFDGMVYVFATNHSAKRKREELYSIKVDPITLIAEDPVPVVYFETEAYGTGFLYSISNDASKLAIVAKPNIKEGTKNAYSVAVFGTDMQQIWSSIKINTYLENTFYIQDMQVDNSGKVFTLAAKYDKPVEWGTGWKGIRIPNYIMLKDGKDADTSSFTLKLQANRMISDIVFKLTNNGTIISSGYYLEGKGKIYNTKDGIAASESVRAGVFCMKSGIADGAILAEDEKELTSGNAGSLNSPKSGSNLRPLLINDKGEIFMTGESISISTDAGGTGKLTEYDEIIVVCIGTDIKFNAFVTIPRRQKTAHDRAWAFSYAAIVNDDYLYLFYNDDPENLNKLNENDKAEYLSDINLKNSILTEVAIDGNGKITKTKFLDNKENGYILYPKTAMLLPDEEILIFGESKNSHLAGRIHF